MRPHAARFRRRTLCILAALCFVFVATGGLAASAEPGELQDRLEGVVNKYRPESATAGISIAEVRSGRKLFSHNAGKLLLPASNQKLVTAAAALAQLGPDYEFTTRLYLDGPLRGDSLHGNIVLQGQGDPALGGSLETLDALQVFDGWASLVRHVGLRQITGHIVVDDTFFTTRAMHPSWPRDERWKPYSAPAGALSVNDNCITVRCRPSEEVGESARVTLKPPVSMLNLQNRLTTHGSKHTIWFNRQAGSSTITVGGNVRKSSGGYTGRVSVPQPARYAAEVFKLALEEYGVSVVNDCRLISRDGNVDRSEWQELVKRTSPLVPVLRTMLKHSQNHYAEQVLRTIGAELYGTGSWEAGCRAAAGYLESLDVTDVELSDGSGLSRDNRLSAAALTSLLLDQADGLLGSREEDLLPVAGRDGTLEARLQQEPYAGAIRAKTGTLFGVEGLSGYIRGPNGNRIAFSILVNCPGGRNSEMERLQNAICRTVVDYLR